MSLFSATLGDLCGFAVNPVSFDVLPLANSKKCLVYDMPISIMRQTENPARHSLSANPSPPPP